MFAAVHNVVRNQVGGCRIAGKIKPFTASVLALACVFRWRTAHDFEKLSVAFLFVASFTRLL